MVQTRSVKIAISVDDALMAQADETARDVGLSRSELIAEALRGFLRERYGTRISEQLNQVYANEPTADERRLVGKFKKKLPLKSSW